MIVLKLKIEPYEITLRCSVKIKVQHKSTVEKKEEKLWFSCPAA